MDQRVVTSARVHRAPQFPAAQINNDPNVPNFRFKSSSCLWFKHDWEAKWSKLHSPTGGDAANKLSVCFDNAVTIGQAIKAGELTDEWRIRYEFNQIYEIIIKSSSDPNTPNYVEIVLKLGSMPCISRDFSTVPPLRRSNPHDFPLRLLNSNTNEFPYLRFFVKRSLTSATNAPIFTDRNFMSLLDGSFPTDFWEDINTWCLRSIKAITDESEVAKAAQQHLAECIAVTSQHSRSPFLEDDGRYDAYGEQIKLHLTIPNHIKLDVDNLPETYRVFGRKGCLFDDADAELGDYPITDRKKTTEGEAARVSVAADRKTMDLVVLNDTRMYNQHGAVFGVTVKIDLVPKFFDPTFGIAQEAFQRCFSVITTRINMDEYRTERSLGRFTPTLHCSMTSPTTQHCLKSN